MLLVARAMAKGNAEARAAQEGRPRARRPLSLSADARRRGEVHREAHHGGEDQNNPYHERQRDRGLVDLAGLFLLDRLGAQELRTFRHEIGVLLRKFVGGLVPRLLTHQLLVGLRDPGKLFRCVRIVDVPVWVLGRHQLAEPFSDSDLVRSLRQVEHHPGALLDAFLLDGRRPHRGQRGRPAGRPVGTSATKVRCSGIGEGGATRPTGLRVRQIHCKRLLRW
mmetsp:Transcript_83733/g.233521  ORF Transcript_83733/g.233521 Transcript_83733/m.233521 type:complete len:222 (-) Transcript_83733:154-819(-)